jgi:hypothetical protein
LIATLILYVACTPDYSHTAFRCDADRDCPAEQACVANRCKRDAQGRFDGVICGNFGCTESQQCCAGDGEHPHCIAAGEVCSGIGALCDGDEDCSLADHCCDLGGIVACNTDCATVACRDIDDCPQGRPHCCGVGVDLPWGTCQAASC